MRPNTVDMVLAADPQVLNQVKTNASPMVAVMILLLPFGLLFLVKRQGLICWVCLSTVNLSKTDSKRERRCLLLKTLWLTPKQLY